MAKNWIIEWFVGKGISEDEVKSSSSENYLELEWIDSFGFLELMSAVEENFGFEFTEDAINDDRIFTVDGFAEIVEEMVG